MKHFIKGIALAALLSQAAFANVSQKNIVKPNVAQPTACIASSFSAVGDQHWKTVTLKLANNCTAAADFQNTTVTFESNSTINTFFWGDFNPLPYPDNQLRITSQPFNNHFLATLQLHFPSYPGADTKLPVGKSISIVYGISADNHIDNTAKVYLGNPVATGNIELTNTSAKPANVSQDYALVHITMNGQNISDVQLPWSGMQTVSGLATGTYALTADEVVDSSGKIYKATITPATLNVLADQTAKASVAYAPVVTPQPGKVAIRLQALPSELTGYTGKPQVSVVEAGTGNSVPATVDWNTTATVSDLKTGTSYSFSTPNISFNNYQCTPTFNPTTLVAATTAPTTNLTYACSQVAQTRVTLNVTGAPTTLPSLKITLTPNNNTAPVSQVVTLSNGSGTDSVLLIGGVIYTVSADPVSGYTASFNPQPLTAVANAVETITLKQNTGGNTPVDLNGQLKVCGTKLCNEHGVPIQLKGMSSHGIQWYGWQGSNTGKACLTPASLDALANNFKASVVRIAMYIQEGGYETNPTAFTNQVNTIINEVSKRGMYALIDFHMLSPGDPNYNLERAKKFFTDIANANKGRKNLLYEIANEPNGVSWNTIKNYANQLIPVIRAIDPNTVILVGTRAWSSLGVSDGASSQEIINSPLNFPNIMYTFHFYAASHRDSYLNELDRASNTLPIFVTEFGTQTYSGDGGNDFAMSDRYMQLMATKKISWTNWNYSDDFRSGAIWTTGTCPNGAWTDSRLKPAGVYIKNKILN